MANKKIVLAMLLAVVIVPVFFSFAWAQNDRELEVDYPDIGGIAGPTKVTVGLPEYIRYIFNFVVGFAGVILLYALIRGGLSYLASGANVAKLKTAREQLGSVFLGIVILLSSYIILTTINPQLAILNLPIFSNLNLGGGTPATFTTDEASIIYYEIPIGQMIKNGVWKTSAIEAMTNIDETGILDEFEKFITSEITTRDGISIKRISDLNKYLKTLAESCSCSEMSPICTKPKNFTIDVGCTGDPCEKNRDKIEDVLDINSKLIENPDEPINSLKEFNDKIKDNPDEPINSLKEFLEEQDKFFNNLDVQEKFSECLETGFLITQGEYLQSVRYYEDQGIKTEVVQSYMPSKGDPFTFYCTVGGTMMDIPIKQDELSVPISGGTGFDLPPSATEEPEPLSCPGVVPIGEIIDVVGSASVISNENLTGLTELIDELTIEMRDMADRISECNEDSCKSPQTGKNAANCKCFPNPCYIPPGVPCPPGLGFCVGQMCMTPCLKPSPGSCEAKNFDAPNYGSPCPLGRLAESSEPGDPPDIKSMEKTIKDIKRTENTILEAIEGLRQGFSNTPYVVETPQQIPIDLVEGVKWVMGFCRNEDIVNPTWAMVNCGLATGNIGPDGNEIAGCDLRSFFCCTGDRAAAENARLSYSSGGGGGGGGQYAATYYTPYVGPPVATDGACNQRIITQASKYDGILYSQGWNKSTYPAECRTRSRGHCYTAAENKGPEGVQCLDCSGFASRVYRDLGILPLAPTDPSAGWCHHVAAIIANRSYFYEISAQDILPGDLVTNGSGSEGDPMHVVIYESGDASRRFWTWQEGGGGGGGLPGCNGKVCRTERTARSNQRYWRRVNECDTF